MTIPTISEIKGNTLLELFKNGYNALKNAIVGKQNKLTAGSNIVISEDNVISAIEGGQAVLDNYYTKQEVDSISDGLEDDIQAVANELPDMTQYYTKSETDSEIFDAVANKVNADAVYTKSEIDNMLGDKIEVIDATLDMFQGDSTRLIIDVPVLEGDILVCTMAVSVGGTVTTRFKGVTVKGGSVSNTFIASTSPIQLRSYTLEQSTFSGREILRVKGDSLTVSSSSTALTEYMTLTQAVCSVKIYRKVVE